MHVTVVPDESRSVRVSDETVRIRPPDRIAFEARGTIRVTEGLLAEFAGASLKPVRIDVSTGDSPPVEIDLEGPASLRLDTVDVGVEFPDADDLSAGVDAVRSSGDDDSSGTHPGAVAFTVEGTIRDVPEGTLALLSEGTPTLESVTFAVEDPVRGDGGSGDDALVEITLFGYGVVVRRNGVVEIGIAGNVPDVGLP